jgi:transcriptional regulator with XRE-family HTH domain
MKKAFRDAFVRANVEHGIAHQVRTLRTDRDWSQRKLAGLIGVKGQSAVARLEDPSYGRYSMATLLKLAQAFDVALLVKFVPYSRLLKEVENLSPEALSAASFESELSKLSVQTHPSTAAIITVVPDTPPSKYVEQDVLMSNASLPYVAVQISGQSQWSLQ